MTPGSPEGDALAARHRAAIERFTAYYDDVEPGLARFVHDVVLASIMR